MKPGGPSANHSTPAKTKMNNKSKVSTLQSFVHISLKLTTEETQFKTWLFKRFELNTDELISNVTLYSQHLNRSLLGQLKTQSWLDSFFIVVPPVIIHQKIRFKNADGK